MLNKVLNKKNILISFSLTILLSACTQEVKVSKYTSMPLLQGTFKKTVESKGVVKPMTEEVITIPDNIWGTLEMMIPEGTTVKKGDIIAKVNIRDMEENYRGLTDRYYSSKAATEKQKLEVPIEMLKLDAELNKKQSEVKAKSLDYKLVLKGPKDDARVKAKTDIEISRLKLDNHPLAKKKELYQKGYVSEQEMNNADIEYQGIDNDLKKAKISEVQLTPDYQKPDINKSRVTEEQAQLDLKVSTLENQAKKSSLLQKSQNGDSQMMRYKMSMKRYEQAVIMTSIRSPIDGIVIYPKIWGWRKPYVGMEVWNGFSFLNVAETRKLKIETRINEQEIVNVKNGMTVEIKIGSLPDKVFKGKVIKIGKLPKYLDERNPEGLKYFDVDISLDNKLKEIKTNMNVDLNIISSDISKSYYLPIEALVEDGKNDYVYFEENNQPVKKAVKIKERSRDYIILADKLNGNEHFYILPSEKEKI